jgi:UDPglucose--hexose-1-phosphate uridylyltransferase
VRSSVEGSIISDSIEELPMASTIFDHPHRRFNPLTGDWILVSPQRARRPWQGKVEALPETVRPQYDPGCYLCPGNTRAGGLHNPPYNTTFVFTNDFAAIEPVDEASAREHNDHGLLIAHPESGICRVVCFSPRHDLTLAEMDLPALRAVVEAWAVEHRTLGMMPSVNYVQIFENKGEIMGCSNPHPHGQIWAEASVPVEPAKELRCQKTYLESHGTCLLCDYLLIERQRGDRMVCENDHFAALVPFWAVWPFEILVLSRRHCAAITDTNGPERDALADIVRRVAVRYDNIFATSFPYSMGLHQAPTDELPHPEWHFHLHFYPPLLRSATVKKFMVGYEMLANPQRDVTAEFSAQRLREQSETHFGRSTS